MKMTMTMTTITMKMRIKVLNNIGHIDNKISYNSDNSNYENDNNNKEPTTPLFTLVIFDKYPKASEHCFCVSLLSTELAININMAAAPCLLNFCFSVRFLVELNLQIAQAISCRDESTMFLCLTSIVNIFIHFDSIRST